MTNSEIKEIKALAKHLLNTLNECPDKFDRQEISFEFSNGLYTPNKYAPNAVYVKIDGILWRLMKGQNKNWIKC